MTRILIVESAGNLWGSERALLDLIDGLGGEQVAVCCPPRTPLIPELKRRRVRVYPMFVAGLHTKSRWRRLQAAFGVLRACLRFSPQVIHLNQAGIFRLTTPAATLLRLPVVAHVRLYEDAAYLAAQVDKRRLAGIIAISASVEAEVRQFSSLDAVPVHRIYDAYTYADTSATERCSGDVETEEVAVVGRIVPIKAQDVLVQALALLEGQPIRCLLIGEGEPAFVDEVKRLSASLPALQWFGFRRDVLPLLRGCSLLVCPSWREPLGRVIFEAWEAGAVPIVYAGSGGAAEVIALADGGVLYDEQTPHSIAAALRSAIAMPHSERSRLIANGRDWLSANCDPKQYGQKLSAIFAAAAQRVR